MTTRVWLNDANGHTYSEDLTGCFLNGFPVTSPPDWAGPLHDREYGKMIAWDGGDCPVHEATQVRCLFRGRRPYMGRAIYEGLKPDARAAMWRHAPSKCRSDPAADIISYQVRVA